MGEKCLDNIDVFDLNRIIRNSSLAQFILAQKCCGREGSVFSYSIIFTFHNSYGKNCPLQNECILHIYIKVYMRCFISVLVLETKFLEGSNYLFYPPGYILFVTLRKLAYFSRLTFL